MAKTMTKYQLDHFEGKVRRQFDPLIEDQELLVKQYTTQATNKAVAKLSKKWVQIKFWPILEELNTC